MAGMKISELDFLRLLPAFMRDDEAAQALSRAMDKILGEPGKRLHTLSTWGKEDELTESECDEMAWELDIDWYDSTGMTLEEKRETIKYARQIKSKRGTKWAVERLISTHFGDGFVLEWFETGDAPYTFKVMTTNPNVVAENFDKFVEAANVAKNERSHITGIYYLWQQGADPGVEVAPSSAVYKYELPQLEGGTVGFVVKPSVETEPESVRILYDFRKTGDVICGENGVKATLGAAIVGSAIVGKSIIRS